MLIANAYLVRPVAGILDHAPNPCAVIVLVRRRSVGMVEQNVTWRRYGEVVQRDKGIRVVQPDSGGKDVFGYISAVQEAAYACLAESAKIS